jgi:hypothetical protein
MVSSALPAGGICSGVLNESIILAICYLLLLLLFCFRAGPFLPLLPGR